MYNAFVAFGQDHRRQLQITGFIVAGLAAVYCGAIQPMTSSHGTTEARMLGSTVLGQSLTASLRSVESRPAAMAAALGGVPRAQLGMASTYLLSGQDSAAAGRKIIRTSSFELVVDKPAQASRKIQQLAEDAGGFVVNSETNGDGDATSANLTLRVPAAKFESTQTAIRNLAQKVDSERVQAEDVSRQYVDSEARLRNLHAQETQYLAILKTAHSVKDTLDVSSQLDQVRGELERQQSEFNALSKQVELVAVTVSLRKEIAVGLSWQPSYQFRSSARQGLEGLIDYSSSMLSFLFYLPAIALWFATILVGGILSWRALRWAGRIVFVSKSPAVSG